MIPIRDDNPTHHTPHITFVLIALNVVIFIIQFIQPPQKGEEMLWKYGYIPAKLVESKTEFEQKLAEGMVVPARDRRGNPIIDPFRGPLMIRQALPAEAAEALPAWVTIFSCMFLHGGWMHLLGNMLYLWIFGNNVEDRLGPVLFVIFYLGTGVIGNLLHTAFDASLVPLVGASGAISGVMGGYILLFTHSRILAVVPMGWYWFTVKLPAWMFLGMYILIQNLYPAYFGRPDGVAYWAHIGGFAAGLALILVFPKRALPAARRMGRPIDDDDADFVL